MSTDTKHTYKLLFRTGRNGYLFERDDGALLPADHSIDGMYGHVGTPEDADDGPTCINLEELRRNGCKRIDRYPDQYHIPLERGLWTSRPGAFIAYLLSLPQAEGAPVPPELREQVAEWKRRHALKHSLMIDGRDVAVIEEALQLGLAEINRMSHPETGATAEARALMTKALARIEATRKHGTH